MIHHFQALFNADFPANNIPAELRMDKPYQ